MAEEDLADIDLSDNIVKNVGRKLRAHAILLGEMTKYEAEDQIFDYGKSAGDRFEFTHDFPDRSNTDNHLDGQ